MVLYHGSQNLIKKPYYGGGRAANDYGRGFYCTESESLACEWAVSEKHDGYANCYDFRDDGLSVLDLNGPGYTILHWLAVLLRHRTFDARYGVATLAKQYLLELRDCGLGSRMDSRVDLRLVFAEVADDARMVGRKRVRRLRHAPRLRHSQRLSLQSEVPLERIRPQFWKSYVKHIESATIIPNPASAKVIGSQHILP